MLHGTVVIGGEHETNAGFLDTGCHLLRRQHDVGTQGLQHIGTAGTGRHAAAAVLGHLGAGSGRHEDGRGRYVETVRRIAAGTDDIDEAVVVGNVHPVVNSRMTLAAAAISLMVLLDVDR